MPVEPLKGLLIADFTVDNLKGSLLKNKEELKLEVKLAPFGQVQQVLSNTNADQWKANPDFAVVWTLPWQICPSFQRRMDHEFVSDDQVMDEVDAFAALLLNIRESANYIFVPAWSLPTYYRGLGMLNMDHNNGISNLLMRMNLRLIERLAEAENIKVLDPQPWLQAAGKNAFNAKLWYMGKIPFSMEVFNEAAKDIITGLKAFRGMAKKLVVLDLDDTLWGGIVGDDGWENLKIGGHDPHGESFASFQRALKSLTRRGIVLGIVSKNNEEVALEAIKSHPEMVLKMEDFVGWRINWNDKAQNIVDLVAELNLGLQSVVFLDDNPVERARVRDMLPEVLVPEFPKDKMQYASFLQGLRCFESPAIGHEDQKRTEMYRSEKEREALKKDLPSVEDWLHTLNIEVTAEELNKANLKRTVQLLNKTNQMNLTTRRISEGELLDWIEGGDRKLWTFRVADKFGDAGLTGIMSLEKNGKNAKIVDFILSCRVMGRQIEECMVHQAVKHLEDQKLETLKAEYLPTKKNKPCLEFWQRSNFNTNGSPSTFIWSLKDEYPLPGHIKLVNAN